MEEIVQGILDLAEENSNLYKDLIKAKDRELRQWQANYMEQSKRLLDLEDENIKLSAALDMQDPKPF